MATDRRTPEARLPRQTIGELARVVVTDVSHVDVPVLSITMEMHNTSRAVRGRMASAVFRRSRRQQAVSFDPSLGSLVLQTVLVVLNGVATDALGTDGGWGPWRWWMRQRLVWRLTARHAGADTPVPMVEASRAAEIGVRIRTISREAGLSDEESERLTDLIVSALVVDARQGGS